MKKLSEKELNLYKGILAKEVVFSKNNHKNLDAYSLNKEFGKMLYDSFSDDEIINILIERAKFLDHSPSKKEILPVFVEYIKCRFEKWSYAMERAGLSKSTGSGSKTFKEIQENIKKRRKIIEKLKQETIKRGYIPHPHQLPDELIEEIKKHFKYWGDLVALIDVKFEYQKVEIYNLDERIKNNLQYIKTLAYDELKRTPLKTEVPKEIRDNLRKEFGSWRNILYQIGLVPVEKKKKFANTYLDHRKRGEIGKHSRILKDCKYQVFSLDEKDYIKLLQIYDLQNKEEKELDIKNFSKDCIKSLLEKCGSWENVLYQLNFIEEEM